MTPETPGLKKPLFVVLADIRSRENVGSIFRTADAAGVSKIYLCGITPRPPHEKISKTALGAEESVVWEYHAQTWRLLQNLKKGGYPILFLEQTRSSKNIFEYASSSDASFDKNYSKKSGSKLNLKTHLKNSPGVYQVGDKIEEERILSAAPFAASQSEENLGLVLVLGNEVSGISKKLLNYATDAVEIPMYGTKESLNVAVAFGIAIYALRRM